ncbi:hypothetical protein FB567DRAFT_602679 [Paraphoma chrysanthemicola]|uniref:Uncharacterized protein n=1 Tax=Paraphoma chrysanthemicola TaxID=798071 RepID=A0A8K0R5D6_9PLEO|nr:hypothetical protein FB567DRAFT_602679 [Paraphoma chrysanthemicola]
MYIILILSAIASLLQPILSADCYGDKGQHPDETWAWTIRQSMCGDNGCALSDSERGNNAECTLFAQVRNGTVARASRSTTTGQYRHCWDALGNAISQCFRDTSVEYTGKEGKMQGNWALDGESYWIQIITGDEFLMPDPNAQSLIGIELDTVDNNPNTPGRE